MLNNGQLEIKLKQYTDDSKELYLSPDKLQDGFGLIDYWAVGYFDEGIFKATAHEARSLKHPDLEGALKIMPIEGKTIAIHIVDIYGNQEFSTLNT